MAAAGTIDLEALADQFAPRKKPAAAPAVTPLAPVVSPSSASVDLEALADQHAPRPATPPTQPLPGAFTPRSYGGPPLPTSGDVTAQPAPAGAVAPAVATPTAAPVVAKPRPATKPLPPLVMPKNVAPRRYNKSPSELTYAQAQEDLKNLPPALTTPGRHEAEFGPVAQKRARATMALGKFVTQEYPAQVAMLQKEQATQEAEARKIEALHQSGKSVSPALLANHESRRLGIEQRSRELEGLRQKYYSEANAQGMDASGRVTRAINQPLHGGRYYPGEQPTPTTRQEFDARIMAPVGTVARGVGHLFAGGTMEAAAFLPAANAQMQWEGKSPALTPIPYRGAAGRERGIKEKNQVLSLVQALGAGLHDDGTVDRRKAVGASGSHTLSPMWLRMAAGLNDFQKQLIPVIRQQLKAEQEAFEVSKVAQAGLIDGAALLAGEALGPLIGKAINNPTTRALFKQTAPELFARYIAAGLKPGVFETPLSRGALNRLIIRQVPKVAEHSLSGGLVGGTTAAGITGATGGTPEQVAEAFGEGFKQTAAFSGVLHGAGALAGHARGVGAHPSEPVYPKTLFEKQARPAPSTRAIPRPVLEAAAAQGDPAAQQAVLHHEAWDVQQHAPLPDDHAQHKQYGAEWKASPAKVQHDALHAAAVSVGRTSPALAQHLALAADSLRDDFQYTWVRRNAPDNAMDPTVPPPNVSPWRQMAPEDRLAIANLPRKEAAAVRETLLHQDVENSLRVIDPEREPTTNRAELGEFKNEADLTKYADDLHTEAERRLAERKAASIQPQEATATAPPVQAAEPPVQAAEPPVQEPVTPPETPATPAQEAVAPAVAETPAATVETRRQPYQMTRQEFEATGADVMHGTARQFEKFDPKAKNNKYSTRGGFFFTEDPRVAQTFADEGGRREGISTGSIADALERWTGLGNIPDIVPDIEETGLTLDAMKAIAQRRTEEGRNVYHYNDDGALQPLKSIDALSENDLESGLMIYPKGQSPRVISTKVFGETLDLRRAKDWPEDLIKRLEQSSNHWDRRLLERYQEVMAEVKHQGHYHTNDPKFDEVHRAWDVIPNAPAVQEYAMEHGIGKIHLKDAMESGWQSIYAPDVSWIGYGRDPHKAFVIKALAEGEAVPPEVLTEYPDVEKWLADMKEIGKTGGARVQRAGQALAEGVKAGAARVKARAEAKPAEPATYAGPERRTDEGQRKRVVEMTPEEKDTELFTNEQTGLPNKRAYWEAEKRPYQAAIDADSLKWWNDTLGHDEGGNALLQAIADGLQESGLSPYHIQGDEFVVQGKTPRQLKAALDKVNNALKGVEIVVPIKGGGERKFKGAEISYAIAKTNEPTGQLGAKNYRPAYADANNILDQTVKVERERSGVRAPRGERPPGLVEVTPGERRSGPEPADRVAPAGRQGGEGAASKEVAPKPATKQAQPREQQRAGGSGPSAKKPPAREWDTGDEKFDQMARETEKGPPPETRWQQMVAAGTRLKNGVTRIYEHLPRGGEFAPVTEELKRAERSFDTSQGKTFRLFRADYRGLDNTEYQIMRRGRVLRDMTEEIAKQKAVWVKAGGTEADFVPALPRQFTEAEVAAVSKGYAPKVTPKIEAAIKREKATDAAVLDDLFAAMEPVTGRKPPEFDREEWLHHAVIQYMEGKNASGAGSKIKVPGTLNALQKREGSGQDYITGLIEARSDWIPGAIRQTQFFKLISTIETHHDISPEIHWKSMVANDPTLEGAWNTLATGKMAPADVGALANDKLAKLAWEGSLPDTLAGKFRGVIEKLATRHDEKLAAEQKEVVGRIGEGATDQAKAAAAQGKDAYQEAARTIAADLSEKFKTQAQAIREQTATAARAEKNLAARDKLRKDARQQVEAARRKLKSDLREAYRRARSSSVDERAALLADAAKFTETEAARLKREAGRPGVRLKGRPEEKAARRQAAGEPLTPEDLTALSDYAQWLTRPKFVEGAQVKRSAAAAVKLKAALGRDLTPTDILTLPDYKGQIGWMPRRGDLFDLSRPMAENMISQAMADLGATLKVDTSAARKALFRGMVIDERLGKTLDAFGKSEGDTFHAFMKRGNSKLMAGFKWFRIVDPQIGARYWKGNAISGLGAMVQSNVKALAPRIVNKAVADFGRFSTHGVESEMLAHWLDRGGMDDLFEAHETGKFLGFKPLAQFSENPPSKASVAAQNTWALLTRFPHHAREGMERYGSFLAFHEDIMRNGGKRPSDYAASIPSEIDAIPNPLDKAMKLSRELSIDYAQTSPVGNYLARNFAPFARYFEGNIRRELQLIRGPFMNPEFTRGKAIQIAGMRLTGRAAALSMGIIIKGMALEVAAAGYNQLFFPQEEAELDEDTRFRPHIIIPGRGPNGEVRYVDWSGNLVDFLGLAGLDNSGKYLDALINHRMTPKEVVQDMGRSAANRWLQQLGGPVKPLVEIATRKKFFPDVFNPTPMRDPWEYAFDQVNAGWLYRTGWLPGTTRRPQKEGLGLKTLTSIKSVNAAQAKFYDGKDRAAAWLAKEDPNTARAISISGITPRSNSLFLWKEAERARDQELMYRHLWEYRSQGGTQEDFVPSLLATEPLRNLNSEQEEKFLGSLSPNDRAEWRGNYIYWQKLLAPNTPVSDEVELGRFISRTRREVKRDVERHNPLREAERAHPDLRQMGREIDRATERIRAKR